MLCPYCGQETSNKKRFCEICGGDLNPDRSHEAAGLRDAEQRLQEDERRRKIDEARAAAKKVFCPECGQQNPNGVKYCIWCKAKLNDADLSFLATAPRPDPADELAARQRELDERERALKEREAALREAELEARERALQEREEAVYAEEMRGAREASRRREIEDEYEEEVFRKTCPGRAWMRWAFWINIVGIFFCGMLSTGQVQLNDGIMNMAQNSWFYGGLCFWCGLLTLYGWVRNSRAAAGLTVLFCLFCFARYQAQFQFVVGILALVAVFRFPLRGERR